MTLVAVLRLGLGGFGFGGSALGSGTGAGAGLGAGAGKAFLWVVAGRPALASDSVRVYVLCSASKSQ